MGVDYVGSHAKPRLDLGVPVMEFIDQQNDFIGTRVFPIFPTQKKAATFSAITRESITRQADTKRAPRGKYNRDGFGAKDVSFSCEENGLEGPLGDDERELYKTDFDAELITTQITSRRLILAQEIRIAALAFNTTTFTGAPLFKDNSAAPWTTAGSDVIGHVKTAREQVRQNCGLEANSLVMSKSNLNALLLNTGIKAAIQYVARLTEQEIMNALADILGVRKIYVGSAVYNTAKEGKAFTGADVWSPTYALVAFIPDNGQDLSQPSVGRTMLWTADSPENVTVEQYRDEEARADIFRVRQNTDELVIDPYFGHLMKVR